MARLLTESKIQVCQIMILHGSLPFPPLTCSAQHDDKPQEWVVTVVTGPPQSHNGRNILTIFPDSSLRSHRLRTVYKSTRGCTGWLYTTHYKVTTIMSFFYPITLYRELTANLSLSTLVVTLNWPNDWGLYFSLKLEVSDTIFTTQSLKTNN